ncbi:thioredoxin [Clostridium ihumii]|uniref:thioredoxin n=1 Tax=Clostridium ihumii TaxID=1470356 RepID=UPI00058D4FFF|nr:thioredoxin [Clostridium ihumii]
MINKVNKEEFTNKVIENEGVVLVDFFATWCGPCKMIAPVLDELSVEMKENVHMVKVDINESMELAKEFKVMSVPTMAIFKNGEMVDRIIGFTDKSDIKSKLESYI